MFSTLICFFNSLLLPFSSAFHNLLNFKWGNFKNEVLEWKHIVEDEATPVIYLCSDREKEKIKEAMELEIENWKK